MWPRLLTNLASRFTPERMQTTNITKESCLVSWKPPNDEGDSEISHYVVEKSDTETEKWLPVGESINPQIRVDELIDGHEYNFRVKAVKKEVESPWLTSKESIIAKNPFDQPDKPVPAQVFDMDNGQVDPAWIQPRRDSEPCPISQAKAKYRKLTEGNDYRVIAITKSGENEPSITSDFITDKPKFLPPKIMTPLRGMKVRRGTTLTADIKFISELAPEVEWSLDGKPIVCGDRVTISNFNDHSILNIIDVKRSDSGPYTLTIKNAHGKDSGTLDVNILDKPGPPEGPLKIVVVDTDMVKFFWQPPKDDGGSPITGYIVEKRDETRGGSWLPVVSFVPSVSFGTVLLRLAGLTDYEFRIMAQNAIGISDPLTSEKSVTSKSPFGVRERPGEPKPVDYDQDFIKQKWESKSSNDVSPIIGYNIEKKERKSNRWDKVNKDPLLSCIYADVTVTDEHQYEYRVSANNVAGNDPACETSVPITAKPMREKPKLYLERLYRKVLRVKAGEPRHIIIPMTGVPAPTCSWKLNDEPLPNSNRIHSEATENSAVLSIPVTKRSDNGKYTITAKNSQGEDSADITVSVYSKPDPPKNLEYFDVTSNSVTLKWNKPDDDGGSDIIGYQVKKREVGIERWTPVSPLSLTTSCIARNLEEGKQYLFRVRAENMHGVSHPLEGESVYAKNPYDLADAPEQPKVKDSEPNFSNLASLLPSGDHGKPINVIATNTPDMPKVDKVTKNSVKLSWSKPLHDGGSKLQGYLIEKKPKVDKEWDIINTIPHLDTTFTVPNLTEGEEYEFRVTAVNNVGYSPPSRPCALVKVENQPDKPRIDVGALKDITVKAGQEFSLNVPFTGFPKPNAICSRNDVEMVDKNPRSLFKVGDDFAVLGISNVKRTDSGQYKLVLKNSSGFDIAYCNVTVLDKPGPPQGPLEISDIAPDNYSLSWKPPLDDGGSPVINYVIEKLDPSLNAWIKVSSCVLECHCDVIGLEPNKEYSFRVCAENQYGIGIPLTSEKPILTEFSCDVPSTPHITESDETNVSLIWKSPESPKSDGGYKIQEYQVEYKDTRGRQGMKNTTLKVPNLQQNTEHEFRVKTKNAADFSNPSKPTDSLKIKTKSTAPKIKRCPNEVSFPEHDNGKIKIFYSGTGPFDVQLYKDGVEVKEDNHLKFTVFDDYVIIYFRDALKTDEAKYKIILKNDSGQAEATFDLKVIMHVKIKCS